MELKGQVFNTFGMNCHQCDGTLDAGNVGRDGEITVLDIYSIAHKPWIYCRGLG
jgi:hypothetical protein